MSCLIESDTMTEPCSNRDNDFVNLPAEVLLTIYEAQDSFRDIRSLFSTCKPLLNLWQSQSHSLSSRLLSRQTPCYNEVSALVTAEQSLHTTSSNSPELFLLINPSLEQRYQSTVERIILTKKFTTQSRYLCEVIETRFLAQKQRCQDAVCRAHPSSLLPKERIAVIRAHHFIKLFCLSHSNATALSSVFSECKEELERMSDEEKCLVKETVRIMWDYAMPWDKLRLGICVPVLGLGMGMMEAFEFGGGDGGGGVKDWREGFEELKRRVRTEVRGCGECIWDEMGVFGREVQGGDGVRWISGG